MQFTGLLDKNGKEIYEGDIIAVESTRNYVKKLSPNRTPSKQLVIWDSMGFTVESKFRGFDTSLYNFCKDDGFNVEIIGNVFENPELLTQ